MKGKWVIMSVVVLLCLLPTANIFVSAFGGLPPPDQWNMYIGDAKFKNGFTQLVSINDRTGSTADVFYYVTWLTEQREEHDPYTCKERLRTATEAPPNLDSWFIWEFIVYENQQYLGDGAEDNQLMMTGWMYDRVGVNVVTLGAKSTGESAYTEDTAVITIQSMGQGNPFDMGYNIDFDEYTASTMEFELSDGDWAHIPVPPPGSKTTINFGHGHELDVQTSDDNQAVYIWLPDDELLGSEVTVRLQ